METHRNSILKNPECCQNLHMILRKRIRALFLYLLRKKKKRKGKKLDHATVIVPRCFDYFFGTVVLPRLLQGF